VPIQPEDVMPLVLEAVPSFAEEWRTQVEQDNAADEPGGQRLCYVDVADLLGHLVARSAEGETSELRPLLAVVERLHVEGDDYVRQLATIGYLEGLQGSVAQGELPDVRPFLGPESLRWWRGLEAFWGGRAKAVLPVD
jgi:hypothetical protein